MLSATLTKNELFNELSNKLKTRESKEAIYREITEYCKSCYPSSPVICVELCQLWHLKRELRNIIPSTEQISITTLLKLVMENDRYKTLEALIDKSLSFVELEAFIKKKGCNQSSILFKENNLKPLIDVNLVKKEENLYNITPKGKKIYNIITKSDIAKLLLDSNERAEQILDFLAQSPKSYAEIAKNVSSVSLHRILDRLEKKGLITRSKLSGRIFYYKTKRRPTRKLSQVELNIFKSLPQDGIAIKDLCKTVGISHQSAYKYLRRLRYKRHIRKEEKNILFSVTEEGKSLAQSLKLAYNIV